MKVGRKQEIVPFFLGRRQKSALKVLPDQTAKHTLMLLSYSKKKNSMTLDLMEVQGISWPMGCPCSCLQARQRVPETKILCFGH